MAGIVIGSPTAPGGSLAGFGPPQIINTGSYAGNTYTLPRGTWWVDCSAANTQCNMITSGVVNPPGGFPSPWVLIPNLGKGMVTSDGQNVVLAGGGNVDIMQILTSP